jgi:uncharacterized protein (DUF1330 family)
MAKAYVLFTETVNDSAAMDQYVKKALPTIAKAGGRPIAFDPTPQVLEGDWYGPQTVVLEFDSVEAARAWYQSSDYQAVIGERHAAATAKAVIVSGLD